ncbi:phage protein [Streptococcus uberis]|nr:phage protein [Streptococcus uberis]
MKQLNLTGERFGRLSVLKKTDKRAGNNEFVYICQCDCGKLIETYTSLLRRGKTRSCGCLHKDTRMTNLSSLNQKKTYVNGIVMDMFTNRKNKNNTTGYKGVYKHHKGYIARICVKGQHHRGPLRQTKDEAYQDRLKLESLYLPKLDTKKE